MEIDTKRRTIVITGASGWLGKRLTATLENSNDELLKNGFNIPKTIIPLAPLSDYNEKNKGNFRFVNLNDFENLLRIMKLAKDGIVFHTAGVIHPKLRTKDFFEINYTGTINVVKAAHQAGVKRIIVVSSNSPFGGNKNSNSKFDENSNYNPYMGYGKSKYLMEQFLLSFIKKNNDIEIVIIRPPWFYGPGQVERQSEFFNLVKNGLFPIIGKGTNKRSMVFVDNLVNGMIRAAIVKKAAGKVYWMSDNKSYKMFEIIDTIRNIMQKEFNLNVSNKRIKLPNIISNFSRSLDKMIQGVGLYNQKIHIVSELNMNIVCDNNLAKVELGYNPNIDLEEGMRLSIKEAIEKKFLK